jgi:KDO2-lipid IV(A) lauroyltransferase
MQEKMRFELRTVRYAVEYGAFRFVAAVFAAMPLETASAFSGWLWRRLAPFSKRHARALAHLRLAYPELSEAERDKLARASWENLGRVFAEAFHLKQIAWSDRIVIEPLETMQALAASGRPTVICAPHLGNWELTILGLVRPGLRPASIYQRIKNPFVDAYVNRMRLPYYPGGLLPKGTSTPKRLMTYARDGGTVAFLADLRDHKGIRVPFFGAPAASSVFPAMVARAYGAPLFAAYLVREPGVRFRFRIEEIPLTKTEDRDADLTRATADLQAAFERMIRSAPEQWMWGHRRWE